MNLEQITLSLGKAEVVVDKAFPRIILYKLDGEEAFWGQKDFADEVKINQNGYHPVKVDTRVDETGQAIHYTLHLEKENQEGQSLPFVTLGIEIALTTDGHSKEAKYAQNMKPTDRHIVTYRVTDIQEFDANEQVETIAFTNQALITLSGEKAGYGAVKAGSGQKGISDVFKTTAEIVEGEENQYEVTYPLLYNERYAAAISNNVITPIERIVVREDVAKKAFTFANGTFTYRYCVEPFEGHTETEPLPYAQIIIGGDENGDGLVDWQDAAILFREIMPIPRGSENVKDQVIWIAMNFTSSTSNPFLRVLDNSKILSHYYDGFTQMVLNKGYQVEGHDDSHPDYTEVGIRQGGAHDLNLLGEAGAAYHVKTGIHINAIEYMLDAVNTKLENLKGGKLGELEHGWAWLDSAYLVDQMKDLESGELERRLEDLYQVVPTLSFIYVDVYYRSDYHSYKFAQFMNRHWDVATEFSGPFEGNQIFNHWGIDPYYPSSLGAKSTIYRFLYNGFKDSFNPDPLLKGLQMPGVGTWQSQTNLFEGIELFYNQNLPTKYMQASPIMKLTENRIDFENGSYVAREGEKVKLYSKDKQLIAIMSEEAMRCKSTLFIPWSMTEEDKIYYWNNEEGATTWQLPKKWHEQTEVYVYELTAHGRKFIETLPVTHHTVTLDYKAQTPYVIEDHKEDTSGLPQETVWGEGSLVKDPGFDSLNFGEGKGNWMKLSKSGATDHIQMVHVAVEEGYDHKLCITGKEDALVVQEIEGLEAGATYTVSAWVSAERLVELGMVIGEQVQNTFIHGNDIIGTVVDHKYSKTAYQRIRFDITVPEGENSGKLFIHVPQTDQETKACIDDVRIFRQPGKTDRHKGGAIYFEDFENVDEGWGIFEYALNGGESKVHLARKDPQGRQVKSYAFDGEWSLKISDNKTGEVVSTYPSLVKFQPGVDYTVTFDYTLFAETKGATLPADEAYPYTFAAKDKEGNVLAEETLKASTLGTGEYGGNSNHDPSVERVSLTFTAAPEEGTYITISTPNGMPNGAGETTSTALNILMIDNVAIYSEGHEEREAVLPDYPIFKA